MTNEAYCEELARNAASASRELRTLTSAVRDKALREVAASLRASVEEILAANETDVLAATRAGMAPAMVDRLTLTPGRIEEMAKGVSEIADFADPIGKVLEERKLPNGIALSRVSVPMGSVFFIYESRPNVTIDGGALCFKAGNSVILRGGKESVASSTLLAGIFRSALAKHGITPDAVQYVNNPDRELLKLLLKRNDCIDLVIPRGGEGLIRAVVEQSSIPVIKHFNGICHVYVDRSADFEQASQILVNAKVQRPSACNAAETVLFDAAISNADAEKILAPLRAQGVEFLGDEDAVARLSQVQPLADLSQYHTEYLALKMAVRFVDGVREACDHIEKYSSRHSDAVVATEPTVLDYFAQNVDSSSVMLNASTRFADGGQYGLGAEVGISTDKLHARGPMGVESLCSYKWILRGKGQVRN